MERYRVVGGTARIGLGTILGLTAEQLAPRRHLVDIVAEGKDGAAVVRPRQSLDFKIGETIDLADEPEKRLDGILEAEAGSTVRRSRKPRGARQQAPADGGNGAGEAGGGAG